VTEQEKQEKLASFLSGIAAREFRNPDWVCGFMLADWYMHATGKPDPVPEHRGKEHPMDQALELVAEVAARLGLMETSAPECGDVGIIDFKGVLHGGIFTGRRWVLLARAGLSSVQPFAVTLIKAWRIA